MASSVPSVGEYRLVRTLGTGGMGTVYFGVSPTADRVAVKVIKPELIRNDKVRERFAAEVESLKLVYGSRIARLEDADPYADPAWLAVEYVPGATLRDHVENRGQLPVPLAAMAGAMLADGLGKVHQVGLLHRDLKPQNIILGPDGPKLIDFGLAVLLDRETFLTETGALVGTPAFMAPEQVKGERELTPATDVYGLAATLVFALTGHTLYQWTGLLTLLQQIASPTELPDLSGVPAELAPLIGAMLALDPGARPSLDAARARLLEVAGSGGVPVTELRRQIGALTYDGDTEIVVPPDLSDPLVDPESEPGDGTAQTTVPTVDPAPTLVDSPAPTQVDVTWLVDQIRQQYARRPTF